MSVPASAAGLSAFERPAPGASDCLARLGRRFRALILLAGSPRESPLARATGESMLDLPVTAGTTMLGWWLEQASVLARAMGIERCPVRVLLNRAARQPEHPTSAPGNVDVRLELDRAELRGTGGVLRDACEPYGPGDAVLVCSAHQVMRESLPQVVTDLARLGSDVALASGEGGVPLEFQLINCAVLKRIKSVGFVDLKEQALPALAKQCDVRVASRPDASVYPVRTLDDYIHAVRYLSADAGAVSTDPFAEDWFQSFRLVDPGATVAASARVHDSVVLRGATVGENAVLVRSLVCAGAEVGAGSVSSDRVVGVPREREVGP